MKFSSMKETQEYQRFTYSEAIRAGSDPYWGPAWGKIFDAKILEICRKYITKSSRIVDMGCGTGCWLLKLYPSYSSGLGVDISHEALKIAKSQTEDMNVSYVCCSLEEFYGKEKFDIALMFEIVEHVFEPQIVINNVFSALVPGGYLILTTPNGESLGKRLRKIAGKQAIMYEALHVQEYSWRKVKEMLDSAGFHIVEHKGMGLLSFLMGYSDSMFFRKFFRDAGNLMPSLAGRIVAVAKR